MGLLAIKLLKTCSLIKNPLVGSLALIPQLTGTRDSGPPSEVVLVRLFGPHQGSVDCFWHQPKRKKHTKVC